MTDITEEIVAAAERLTVVPQRSEGDVMEPVVSVPMAKARSPAAIAAADLALDPSSGFQGSACGRRTR